MTIKQLNFSSNNKFDFETLMLDGDYRYEHKFWSDEGENIFQKTVFEKFKTGEDSFL